MKIKIYIVSICALLLVVGLYDLKNNITNTAVAAESQTTATAGVESSIDPNGLFADYLLWPHSANPKPNDTMRYFIEYSRSSNGSGMAHIDINGDGLVDLIYTMHDGSQPWARYYLTLINKGDKTFDIGYKCIYTWNNPTSEVFWYGDCAQ